jgi:outer membrane protein TolC
MNALKAEKQNQEETSKKLMARLVGQSKTEKGPRPTTEDLLEVSLVPKRGVVGLKKDE